ncbi:MAG: A/G-specific adenine glycosylase, partial [Alphaproteobacteria bacterium]|nr:A/G-specific adenine glycosylase [Alphaproteobacteria bacterium]
PATKLLKWYDANARELPWRAAPGVVPDPYRVWLSEIMLQQTQAVVVAPYYLKFLGRWPTVQALAAAELDDVLAAWAGLGYYARGRNLHRTAQAVTEAGGRFPESEVALRALPGIGVYTAAAIASIAFGARASAVDGNVERVVSRLFAVTVPIPKSRPKLRTLAVSLVPLQRTGDFAQGLIELGATVCTARSPDCVACPLSDGCKAFAKGSQDRLPRRVPKQERPTRHGVCFWLERSGQVLLGRRPPRGLLGGMLEIPGTPWEAKSWGQKSAMEFAPTSADWQSVPGEVRHTFTHFHLVLTVMTARTRSGGNLAGTWVALDDLETAGLPSVFAKVSGLARAKV